MALRIGKKKDGAGDDWADAAATPDSDSPDPFAGSGPAAKKSLPPAAMAGIVVLLLAVIGAGVYFFVLQPSADDDTATATPPAQVTPAPETPPNPAPEAPAATPPTPAPAKPAAPAAKAPAAAKPKTPALPKPSLPKPQPTPGIPTGLTGQDGKGLQPGNTVPAVQAVSPALKAQLRQLWQQGAQAKWRGDYAGARRAWTRMLQLHPGHPGVQSAINKLPK